jgi:hypothetical protein
MKICPKCQYHRKASDQAPDWQCPACGIAYSKFERAQDGAATARPLARPVSSLPREASNSNFTLFLVGGLLLLLIGFSVWKVRHGRLSPQQARSSQFDEARKEFDASNLDLALKGFTPLAEAGDAKAQYYLGRIYGFSFQSDRAKFAGTPALQIKWFTKSAQQGEMLVQIELAKLIDRGFGENADRAPATHWYQLAADQGSAYAQYHLGLAYEGAVGLPKDPIQAAAWYRKAAEQGFDSALYQLGLLYMSGSGVSKSNLRAYELMALAEATEKRGEIGDGAIFAGRDREAFAKLLSASELEEANQFVGGWSKGQHIPM